MSSMGTAASWPEKPAAMVSARMAAPSPRPARSATAPGALAWNAISGRSAWAAQD